MPHAILGDGAAMVELRRHVDRVASSPSSTVLILGESGTGKELVARALHDRGARASGPFVPVNCSALPPTLLEEEFFGHEAGAFTDARKRREGLLAAADGGTLFLDEVGELAPALQAKFLRFLEERTFRPLGGARDVTVDVRFVAATNVDLEARVRSGEFREDLYWRLQVVTLRLPPLRDHREDVPPIARHFLAHYSARFHKVFHGLTPEAEARLLAHDWPGNVRELRNAIERVALLEDGPWVEAVSLVLGPASPAAREAPAAAPAPAPASGQRENADLDLERLELRALASALERAHGNVSRAARMLGVTRDAVRHRMKRYGVRVETRVVVEAPEPRERTRPPRA